MDTLRPADFLTRIKRPKTLENKEKYQLVTIKLNHKGVIPRSLKKGSDIKSKMFEVKEGDVILILESMKMEIDVVAPRDGVITSINVATNDKVVEGQVVAVIG